ncbi:unnamed protein product, partial [Penicillium discolor]
MASNSTGATCRGLAVDGAGSRSVRFRLRWRGGSRCRGPIGARKEFDHAQARIGKMEELAKAEFEDNSHLPATPRQWFSSS